jgi:hypothetical protein
MSRFIRLDMPGSFCSPRRVLDAVLRDQAFLAEAAKLQIEIDPMNADELGAVIADTIMATPELVARTKAAMEAPVPSSAAPQR